MSTQLFLPIYIQQKSVKKWFTFKAFNYEVLKKVLKVHKYRNYKLLSESFEAEVAVIQIYIRDT